MTCLLCMIYLFIGSFYHLKRLIFAGFDPLEESSRGLADLLEKENGQKISYSNMYETQKFAIPHSRQIRNNLSHNLPPGKFRCLCNNDCQR